MRHPQIQQDQVRLKIQEQRKDLARVGQALKTQESLLPKKAQHEVHVGFLVVNDEDLASLDDFFAHYCHVQSTRAEKNLTVIRKNCKFR